MTVVTSYTSDKTKEMVDSTIVSIAVINGHLILTKFDGSTVDAGLISDMATGTVGPQGPPGPQGDRGLDGPPGPPGTGGGGIETNQQHLSEFWDGYAYVGSALPGVLSSDLGWTIQKIILDIDDNPISILWSAIGVRWDDRTTLSYF